MHAREGLDIILVSRQHKIPLEGQKGGALSEELGEGRTGGIVHRVFPVVPGLAGIRKSSKGGEILSTGHCALLGMAFGAGFGIRKVSKPQECLKTRDVSSDFKA